MLTFVLWCLLFIMSWPLALLALVAYPFIWLLFLPLRLLGITVRGAFGLVESIILLPAKLIRRVA